MIVAILQAAISLFAAGPAAPETYTRACDGSAIVSAGDHYLLNATDEDNVIRLYRRGSPSKLVREFDLNSFLAPELNKKGAPKESDIEAVARIGDRLYWIGSHGRDKKGNREPSRHRLFATTLTATGSSARIAPAGAPYTGLIAAITAAKSAVSAALESAEPLPHQQGGIDIEGLAATTGGGLLIGFRSPLVLNQALLVEMTNPVEVTSAGAQPKFASPVLLDIGGLGIRDMIPAGPPNRYWILAGEPGPGARRALFSWTFGHAPELSSAPLPKMSGHPEGLLLDSKGTLFISTDEGEQGSPACKDRPNGERSFHLYAVPR